MIVQTIEAEITQDGVIVLKEEITLTKINSVFVTVFSDGEANNSEKVQIIRDLRHEKTKKKRQEIDNSFLCSNFG